MLEAITDFLHFQAVHVATELPGNVSQEGTVVTNESNDRNGGAEVVLKEHKSPETESTSQKCHQKHQMGVLLPLCHSLLHLHLLSRYSVSLSLSLSLSLIPILGNSTHSSY